MHFKSSVVTLLGRTASFDLELASAALFGVVGKADSPLVKFTPALWRVRHMPIGFLFVQGVFQHLVYLLALASQPCPIWIFS